MSRQYIAVSNDDDFVPLCNEDQCIKVILYFKECAGSIILLITNLLFFVSSHGENVCKTVVYNMIERNNLLKTK